MACMALPPTIGLYREPRPRFRAFDAHPSVAAAEAASFEAHPEPQFLVDSTGTVLRANAAGRRLLASRPDVAEFAGRLASSSGTRVREVRAHVAETIRTQVASPELERDLSPGASLAIRAIPLGAAFDFALVLVRMIASPTAGSVSERCNFTRSEALVATRLAHGLSVGEIAAQLGVSVETVRCHLKQAFVKAGVHRQAELVAVMLRG